MKELFQEDAFMTGLEQHLCQRLVYLCLVHMRCEQSGAMNSMLAQECRTHMGATVLQLGYKPTDGSDALAALAESGINIYR